MPARLPTTPRSIFAAILPGTLAAFLIGCGGEAPALPIPESGAWVPVGESRFFPDQTATRIRLGNQTRHAVIAPRDGALRRTVDVPDGAVLELGLGLGCPGDECAGSVVFSVRVGLGPKSAEKLWHKRLDADRALKWKQARIPLDAYAGRRVSLVFRTRRVSSPAAPAETAAPVALWGEPFLIPGPTSPRPGVLLISIDTLRADHLGCYGYVRDTSPVLDALASQGLRFTRAISQSPWTTPAHMSLLTSLYPSSHRVNQGFRQFEAFLQSRRGYRTLAESAQTLAESFRDAGYRTLALTGGATMSGDLGFSQGFDVYEERPPDLDGISWARLTDWLNVYSAAPVFVFFHTFQVHAPYTDVRFVQSDLSQADLQSIQDLSNDASRPPIELQRERLRERDLFRSEVTEALYDGGIRATDDFLGRLFSWMDDLGIAERFLVVVTSDHGEEFSDHDPHRFYDAHCTTVYNELTHVPLILRMPGRLPAGVAVTEPVELIDVGPTMLELAGVAIPSAVQGASLTAHVDGSLDPGQEWVISEATCVGPEMKSLATAQFKYVAAFEPDNGERSRLPGARLWEQLFSIDLDPGEQTPVQDAHPETLEHFRARLEAHFETMPVLEDAEPLAADRELLEQLRSLGYVE